MKIGILGRGLLAIELGIGILEKGGMVRFFGDHDWGGDFRKMALAFPKRSLDKSWEVATTSDRRARIWGTENRPMPAPALESVPTLSEYWQEYLAPLIESYQLDHHFFSGKVLRVQKCFLHPNEEVTGRGRFLDLFRVVVVKSPSEELQTLSQQSPELFQELQRAQGEMNEVMQDLSTDYEVFDDVDVVVDTLTPYEYPRPMGAGGCPALGEMQAKNQKLITYLRPWSESGKIYYDEKGEVRKRLAFVGDSQEIQTALASWGEWVLKQAHPHEFQAYHISHRLAPQFFTGTGTGTAAASAWSQVAEQLDQYLAKGQQEFLEQKSEWEELEDYIKVKKKKPVPPTPLCETYWGYDVISVDQLLDRTGLFLTVERPDFRGEGSGVEMSTLKVDACIVGQGFAVTKERYQSLRPDEKGLYFLQDPNAGVAEVDAVLKQIFSLFSPRRTTDL